MNARTRLTKAIEGLDDLKIELLTEMVTSLTRKVLTSKSLPGSDIASVQFLEDFANRLQLHHATNQERLNKKTFEYLFVASSKAAGRLASRVSVDEHPHADVVVDKTMFSLKTEASASISENTITISKLVEARWIRECRVGQDFIQGVREKIVPHLESYDRILTLRSFVEGAREVRYELVEIPKKVLLRIRNLEPADFLPRTPNGSTSARITSDGRRIFTLLLDGSVEKITIGSLAVSDCIKHATWFIALAD